MAAARAVMYGIPNCGSIKKARAWLEAAGIEYDFHDYKKQGVDEQLLRSWAKQFGWQQVVNRRGMTWRKLDEATREGMDENSAIQIMQDKHSIIKRPIVTIADQVLLGFDEASYQQALGA